MFSILHISDLHRSPTDPIGNEELLSSLVADRDRYLVESPPIVAPDAIVVSGDLVQGVSLDTPDWEAELVRQYDACYAFLAELTDRFVDGDRRNVVIVPGNHDVAWPVARASMDKIDTSPRKLGSAAFGPRQDLRWDWEERQLYRICDRSHYEARFSYFRDLRRRFYDGVELAYPLKQDAYYQLFELAQGRIAVAAFNSCEGNDCFSFHGGIPDDAIASAHLELRDRQAQYELLMAVWHHNIDGAPYVSDYMDVDAVYRMIGGGFRLGLHGHHHRSQIAHRYIHIPEQEPIAVVSAGSLCAGRYDLPTGVNRQYNILELEEDLTNARVHVREMAVSTVFGQARRTEFGGRSYVELKLGTARSQVARSAQAARAVSAAEKRLAVEDFVGAVDLLRPWATAANTYQRTLMVDALDRGQMWAPAVELLTPPLSMQEVVLLIRAAVELRQFDLAEHTLTDFGASLGLSGATSSDLLQMIKTRRVLAG
jgi:3',5'-cyclic AMP phosphodiesterase CpdA